MIRTIKKKYEGRVSSDGAGVKLNRIFSKRDIKDVDPFLLLDFFDSENPDDYTNGFPWHPHRGIETITYLISGEIEHGDNLGNSGVIKPFGCQWMTAGSGIIHQEMPQESDKMLGAQLWLNLPKKHKMTEPKYRDITKKDLGVYEDNEQIVRVICGKYKDTEGAISGTFINPIYFDVSLKNKGKFEYQVSKNKTVYLLLIKGEIDIDGQKVNFKNTKGILLSKGKDILIKSTKNSRFLFMAADPLKEPIAWGGPIVMNTQKELDNAFEELDNNKFIKSK